MDGPYGTDPEFAAFVGLLAMAFLIIAGVFTWFFERPCQRRVDELERENESLKGLLSDYASRRPVSRQNGR